MGQRRSTAGFRPWLGGLAVVVCVGCAERSPLPSAPPPVTSPLIESPAPTPTLGASIATAAALALDPGADPTVRLAAAEAVRQAAPGGAAQTEIAAARQALTDGREQGDRIAADHLSAARQELSPATAYGLDTVAAAADLEAAEAALDDGRRSLAIAYLARASCYLTTPRLAVASAELEAAVRAGAEPTAAVAELQATGHLLAARGAVGRAGQRVAELALAEARAELETARREILAWSGEDATRTMARDALLADLEGALRDVEAASPGLRPRLEALWLKLAEPPRPTEEGTL